MECWMWLEDKRIEIETETDTGAGGDSRRRTRAGDRTGMRHRRGQGIRHGVRADSAASVGGSARCGTWTPPPARSPTWPISCRAGHREGHRRVHLGLLADLVLPARGGRTRRAVGQRPRREERARPAQNRQTRRGVAGQAHREGLVAALVRAARADPTAARLHPAAGRSHPGTRPLLAAAGEAARRRAHQAVLGGVHAGHAVGAGHDRGADRRRA